MKDHSNRNLVHTSSHVTQAQLRNHSGRAGDVTEKNRHAEGVGSTDYMVW